MKHVTFLAAIILVYIYIESLSEESNPAGECWAVIEEVKSSREQGDFKETYKKLKIVDECLNEKNQPQGMKYFYHLGWTQHEDEKFEQAISSYNKGLHLQPDYVFAYWRRGLAHEKMGDLVSAKSDYRQAMDIGMATLPDDFMNILDDYPEIKVKLVTEFNN